MSTSLSFSTSWWINDGTQLNEYFDDKARAQIYSTLLACWTIVSKTQGEVF